MSDLNNKTEYAVRIHAYGGPEAMQYEAVEIPAPAEGEVQIRQSAVGINYLDTYHRRGIFPLSQLPGALGVEAAGTVVAVGGGVKRFREGDRVSYACPPIGSYASLRNLSESYLVKLPEAVTFEQAAAATLQGLTVHMLLSKVTRLRAGQSILVHSAAGGLGSLLTQWARRMNLQVIGVVGSEAKVEAAKGNGCDEVIVGSREPFVDGVRRITGSQGVDVVFEGLGGSVFHDSLSIIKPFGQIVNLGQVAEGLPSVPLADLGPARSLTVSVPGVFAYVKSQPNLQGAADELFGLIADGALNVHVGGRFPLSQAADAHRALESRSTTGSLVLLPQGGMS
ncbi:quinone oxidoreductase family protein [Diaphorobacter caeni]|uniref:quinone oxidoreductase family protein n=1 Tax=Diaphorobacter caeni TaxID=2784387 RepID=UPI00188FEE68|nr:quinone oxidoreductase [Diaphorobacter caeni]MBF5007264.1 quinone oxidoreductase [Diaphorobacter caeni]